MNQYLTLTAVDPALKEEPIETPQGLLACFVETPRGLPHQLALTYVDGVLLLFDGVEMARRVDFYHHLTVERNLSNDFSRLDSLLLPPLPGTIVRRRVRPLGLRRGIFRGQVD